MFKSIKSKITISFLMFIMMMATLISYNSYAAMGTESNLQNSSYTSGGGITYNELKSEWELLCSEHGTHIPSENDINPTPADGVVFQTEAYYAVKEERICNPKEAYILNFAETNGGSGYPGSVQKAWWNEGYNIGAHVSDTALARAARNYQAFVNKIKVKPENYKSYSHTFADGSSATIQFPEVDEDKVTPKFDSTKAKVNFNTETNKYEIGPFSLDYVKMSSDGIVFGEISKFKIYTDADPETPLDSSKWKFLHENGDVNTTVPDPNEEFYIEMDYIENATRISNIKMDYRYLMAGGEYNVLSGTYDEYVWKERCTSSCGDNGCTTTCTLEAKEQGLDLNSQTLSVIKSAANWYETVEVELKLETADLQIRKIAYDENGNELSAEKVRELFGKDQYFTFKVTVKNNGKVIDTRKVDVRAGETASAGSYGYDDGDNLTYEVKEVTLDPNSGWEYVGIENESGTLHKNTTVTVTGKNKTKPQTGDIEVNKKISGIADSDETFKFNVVVNYPNGTTDTRIATITVPKGQSSAPTWKASENGGKYSWYGNENATYEVTEIETEASKRYSPTITNGKGYLGQDCNVVNAEVSVLNNSILNQGSLRLHKTIDSPVTENRTFYFTVTIAKNGGTGEKTVIPVTLTVPAGSTESPYWFSDLYKWDQTELSPTYTVTEDTDKGDYAKYNKHTITPSMGTLENNVTVPVEAKNGEGLGNYITINKTTTSIASKDETFKFKVHVWKDESKATLIKSYDDITLVVKQGKTACEKPWTSDYITWSEAEKAPYYEIEEVETEDSKKYKPNINPSSGYLNGDEVQVSVTAENQINMHQGFLILEKQLKDGETSDEFFTFKVKVKGVENTASGTDEFAVALKAGEKVGPYTYYWKGDTAPTFEITELDAPDVNIEVSGGTDVNKTGSTVTGKLVDGDTADVNVKFVNNLANHKGNIKINKKFFSTEKMTDEELKNSIKDLNTSFDVKVTIEGSFVYDGKTYTNTSKVITNTLSAANNWTFTINDIKWWGSEVPTYKVEETASHNCNFKFDHYDCSDGQTELTNTTGHKLSENETVEYTIYNKIPSTVEIDLTFSMAGIAWIDKIQDEKNGDEYYNKANGVYDKGEILKENVEVNVYKVKYKGDNVVSRELAVAYKDAQNNELAFPLLTGTDGAWNVPRITVPGLTDSEKNAGYTKADYDVEFVYDGQTYEPTEFLSYQVNGDSRSKNSGSVAEKAKTYRNATKSVKSYYQKDSMAIKDLTDEQKGNVITNVSGKTPINANGDTTGVVTLANGKTVEIQYESDDAGNAYPTHSKLKTTDSDGRTLDLFKASATTSAGKLTFPFDVDGYDGSSLTNQHTDLGAEGFVTSYKFFATYNYCLHINLGLVERPAADLALTKNLTTAKVVVNEKLYQYNYSGKFDLTEVKQSSLNQDIYVENHEEKIEYTLGLYKSDYYYRAEMYAGNAAMYDALQKFYASINKSVADTEMDVYLTYKIKVENAGGYDAVVNSIDDYYESSLQLVSVDETKYVKTQTGVMDKDGKIHGEENVNNTVTVAKASDYAGNWSLVQSGITGSDKDADGNNIIYNKMTGNDLNIRLASGESKEFTLTFKVRKDIDSKGVSDSIRLGQKANVAEIASYSTFKEGTDEYAGKIDRDSAPANVNIEAYNEKAWYEDDTFGAPRIKVNIDSENAVRTVNGLAWEDNSNGNDTSIQENPGYNQFVGNGIKDNSEKVIADLTTELWTKVDVKNTENTNYTEYDYLWPTSKQLACIGNMTMEDLLGFDTTVTTDADGKYNFNNIIAGDYSVHFTYGDKENVKSADYSTAEYYNGQDYKSARFKAALTDGAQIQADSYLNIDSLNSTDEKTPNNTAVDDERQRLMVVEKSRELDYTKTNDLSNYASSIYGKDGYQMFAETPKLDMNIEFNENSVDGNGNIIKKFDVYNVAFGLEERPITQLSLDKQIEEIILTTSDGKKIMDAKYDISYPVENIKDNGKITANVVLNESTSYGIDNLQYINRDQATNQGYRYINVDSSILEGATVTVKYRFTVLDTGEVDRTGSLANMEFKDDTAELYEAKAKELADKLSVFTLENNTLKNDNSMGQYVGNIYYYGVDGVDKKYFDYNADGTNDVDNIVSTQVRQLVDYIDNNVTYSGEANSTTNTSWKNVTIEELQTGKYIDPSIIEDGNIVDSDGVKYITDNRSNVALSVDDISNSNEMNNRGFIIEIQPNKAETNNYQSSMNLTVSKVINATDSDLQIDNIAEIIKYNNEVGRRDELTTLGNTKPATATEKTPSLTSDYTISDGMKYQRDTSATEVITLSPPTGSGLMKWKMQVIATITGGLVVLAAGIIVIKKKILK